MQKLTSDFLSNVAAEGAFIETLHNPNQPSASQKSIPGWQCIPCLIWIIIKYKHILLG